MISWDTMTRSSLSSTHHGYIHITSPLSQNWTTHRLHLLLPRHPSLPLLHLPLWRAPWSPTTSPGKLFPIKHNPSHTQLHRCKCTCLSHIAKRGRTAPLHSEFFGHYPDHSDTHHHHHHHHHHHQHQHHVASYNKYLRTVLRRKGDVNYCHRSRPRPLHRSALRFYYTISYVISFSHHCLLPLFGYTDVSHSRII